MCDCKEAYGIPVYDGIMNSKRNYFFWTGLTGEKTIDKMIRGIIEDDIMDTCSSECGGCINLTPFKPALSGIGLDE